MRRSRLDLMTLICSLGHVPTESFLLRPTAQMPSKNTHCRSCRRTSDNSLIPTCNSSRHHNIISLSLCANRSRGDDSTAERRKTRQRIRQPRSTFSTAVCIVPPDDAWDTIQRARHLARDTTFYKVSMPFMNNNNATFNSTIHLLICKFSGQLQ
jgi:hypothetical protein